MVRSLDKLLITFAAATVVMAWLGMEMLAWFSTGVAVGVFLSQVAISIAKYR
jgi:hypothetical protein